MFSIVIFTLFLRLAVAAPSIDFQLTPGKTPLDVTASVTNSGSDDISVMKFSPVLATAPVKHFRMFDEQGDELPFSGVSIFYDIEGAGADAWETIPAGQTIVRSIDLSATHELKSAGKHTIWANGRFQVIEGPYSKATAASQTLHSYNTNLTIPIAKSDVAASVERTLLQKRVSIGACSTQQGGTMQGDFGVAKTLAARAADRTRARDGQYVFSQFYHTTDAQTVAKVADTFQKISDAATVSTGSKITANCNGSPQYCTANVLAYAAFFVGVQGQGNVYACPPFWSLPREAPSCSGYGQADVLVHELSHLYGTEDVAYGYGASQQLSTADAVRNADTYMFYSRCKSRIPMTVFPTLIIFSALAC
ncbi:Deuterolysin metalloprotease family-domain-containing protein [Collybia nuda]|uniref:Neutral protease 2 n=1 Tax=Collybia nuda TaxID=64659 RepID=A0A9P5Y6H3_9AGAR|nr:Deuterolysin metalloprotease family-domain-containing protein [Collybia nuda]